MRFVARAHRLLLHRIASQFLTPEDKARQLARTRLRIHRAMEKFTALAIDACPAEAYQRLHSHGIDGLIAALVNSVKCLTGSVYLQDTLLCGPPTCGNGVVELHEDCDDGNLEDGDACPSDCTRNQ